MKFFSSIFLSLILTLVATASAGKDLPKFAVWDLNAGNINPSYSQDLTSILVSEISKLGMYEVYSQENVRTLAGWTAERLQLGCTDTKCLTALGQMDISKLISGRVGKIGNRYSVSLNLFDTQNARAENSISEFGRSEDELIDLVKVAAHKLLGVKVARPIPEKKSPIRTNLESQFPGRADKIRILKKAGVREEEIYKTISEQVQESIENGTDFEDIRAYLFGPKLTTTTSPGHFKMGRIVKDSYTGMEFIFIKGGCYEMGDTFGDGSPEEKPLHEVCVDDFYLGAYEVTQAQWENVMGNNPSHFKRGNYYPVEMVSWLDTQKFIGRLNNQSGRKYRLPTEAEWEYAARSGGKKEKFAGTSRLEELDQYAWYERNSENSSHPIWEKKPNGLILSNMSGNVSEWCADWYAKDYYRNSPKNNPQGPTNGTQRVLRGGSWADRWGYVRSSHRPVGGSPSDRSNFIGFRLGFSAR